MPSWAEGVAYRLGLIHAALGRRYIPPVLGADPDLVSWYLTGVLRGPRP